jgi:hypothetical protein
MTDPIAARLCEITDELAATHRKVIERDETGSITGMLEVPTNVPRLVAAGIAVMDRAWSEGSGDALGRFEQLDAMRTFAAAAAEHLPPQAAPMRERYRQITNAIRLHYDDPSA